VLTQTCPFAAGAVVVLVLGVLDVAAVGVALWVGVAGATALDFLTRLCGVADAAGLGARR
jgi:hypothetical protein